MSAGGHVAPSGAKQTEQPGTGEMISDLWQLVKDYARQETVDPLKALGRFLKFGLPGAILLSLGLLFGSLAIIRGLQTETDHHLTGSLTWVPYLAGLLFAALAAGLAALAIRRPERNEDRP